MPICLKSIPVSFFRELEEVDHRANLPVSDERWQQLTHVSADDPVLKQLHTVIQCGWPERKSDVPMWLRPYFDLREELVVQGSAAPDELSMSYTSANVGVSFKTKLSTTQ